MLKSLAALLLLALVLLAAGPLPERPAPDGSGVGDAPAGPSLGVPLSAVPRLTSNFGEYRAGHYHAGLDYSTGGRIGAAVLAPSSGHVWRVRVSGVGYGRALYLRLDDGRTVVFGHLSRFADAVERAAVAEQDRRDEYEVDFRPGAGALRFARGDTVAWSGESGAGPPHLHAEVRVGEEADVAVLPLAEGWNVADTFAPTLTRLRVAPALAASWVNGGRDAALVDAGDTSAVTVVGAVTLHVETIDRTGVGGNRLATWRVAADIDGRPLAETRLDRMDWRRPAEVRWTYLERAVRDAAERWVALGPPPASAQTIHRRLDGGNGPLFTFAPGDHRLRVVAEDFAGNRTERLFRLRVLAGPDPGWRPRVDALRVRSRERFLEIAVPAGTGALRLREPGGRIAPLDGIRIAGAGGEVIAIDRPSPPVPGLWTVIRAADSTEVGAALWVDPASGSSATARRGGLTLEVPPGAVYEPTWIGVSLVDPPAADAGSELTAAGPLLVLEPRALPFRGAATVSAADAPPDAGIGRRGGDWIWEGAERAGATVSASIGNLESVALVRDRRPPRITWALPADGPPVDARPDLSARVVDGGAGVTWRTLALTVDGRHVIAEWDPEAARYRPALRAPLAPGEHEARLVAVDRAGNRTESTLRFRVR